MKKILVASTALVAVAFAGQANASEKIKLSVGGYMEQWAGFSDEDGAGLEGEGRPNAFQSDTEIHFKGSTTLDNGIEVGATVELEGETSGDQIDEQYLYVNGGFGQVKLGKDDSAADDMGITAPAVGPVGVNDGDMSNWADAYLIDTVRSSGDQNRLTYYTPSFGGFRAGVSYADDSNRNGADGYDNQSGSGDNIVSAGVEYLGDFDGWSLGLSATGEESGEGAWYGAGVNVGFGNFTVGGSYGHTEDDYGLNLEDDGSNGQDLDAFDVGVSYAMDAAAVSATYGYEDFGTGEIQAVDLGLAYTLGAGVAWKSSVFWFDQENDGEADNDGYGVVTGIRLDF
ncbi:porin [Thalassospira xianhensis]|uniref:Porin n=1 Tax=Thalassospira xianhensis MCCC 1A02616 TaxID=1177929 RepID=A0A367UGH7_9PROT|nr:porin [Thalassospira xianhensis]RCK07111.1 porin [Thalassospira xianhensis MCCC 1A02616]